MCNHSTINSDPDVQLLDDETSIRDVSTENPSTTGSSGDTGPMLIHHHESENVEPLKITKNLIINTQPRSRLGGQDSSCRSG